MLAGERREEDDTEEELDADDDAFARYKNKKLGPFQDLMQQRYIKMQRDTKIERVSRYIKTNVYRDT